MTKALNPSTMRQQAVFDIDAEGVFANVWQLDEDGGAHGHDFLEIGIVLGGTGQHITSAGTTPARLGSVFVLRPGAWHWYRACRDLRVANCCLSVPALTSSLAFLRFVPAIERLLWRTPMAAGRHGVSELVVDREDASRAGRAVGDLIASLMAPAESGSVSRSAQVMLVLGHLVAHEHELSRVPTWPATITAVVDMLEDVPEAQWTLQELASRVHLTPTYLARLFKETLGLPPLGYLARLRAERAAILLSTTDLGVGQVGGLVGWTDPNYFARRFRQLSGLTPSVYRERGRAGGDGTVDVSGASMTVTPSGASTTS